MASRRNRRIAQLERRAAFLAKRVENYKGKSDSYDQAELGALRWAVAVIRSAIALGAIDELETAAEGLTTSPSPRTP